MRRADGNGRPIQVASELVSQQPRLSSAVAKPAVGLQPGTGSAPPFTKGLAKRDAQGKRAYVAEETQFDLGVKRVSNKITESLEDAGGEITRGKNQQPRQEKRPEYFCGRYKVFDQKQAHRKRPDERQARAAGVGRGRCQ